MEWTKEKESYRVPIKSWCEDLEDGGLAQAENLANHPKVYSHIALMPDCHQGYGMPIGGVIGCEEAVIPNAVGVDIGCGMCAVKTDVNVSETNIQLLRDMTKRIKGTIPVGEGHPHRLEQSWEGFEYNIKEFKDAGWYSNRIAELARQNLGTLGGGNHFIEVQRDEDGTIWLMIHSGSRNLGNMVAQYHNKVAIKYIEDNGLFIPNKDLAYLPSGSDEGKEYIRDMNMSLAYAMENRKRIMENFKDVFKTFFNDVKFEEGANIHHNYAALEKHFDKELWIHRKGATSAKKGEVGIIPGSMGAPSYIVEGKGNSESFESCSHGAGRTMGRMEASRRLSIAEADKAMEGIVCDRWKKQKKRLKNKAGTHDLGEAPQAYKNIDKVIKQELDLIKPLVKLFPLAVVKG
ncbi:MAG: RtcB family protein [Desulfobacterales bacterium]|nr:RtcB family protein [Desulfobacterales bacterium]MCP4161106.1 RtcB family protein [Deltaproteobacteria bacterium]